MLRGRAIYHHSEVIGFDGKQVVVCRQVLGCVSKSGLLIGPILKRVSACCTTDLALLSLRRLAPQFVHVVAADDKVFLHARDRCR